MRRAQRLLNPLPRAHPRGDAYVPRRRKPKSMPEALWAKVEAGERATVEPVNILEAFRFHLHHEQQIKRIPRKDKFAQLLARPWHQPGAAPPASPASPSPHPVLGQMKALSVADPPKALELWADYADGKLSLTPHTDKALDAVAGHALAACVRAEQFTVMKGVLQLAEKAGGGVLTYRLLIGALVQAGRVKAAMKMIARMQKRQVQEPRAYHSLIEFLSLDPSLLPEFLLNKLPPAARSTPLLKHIAHCLLTAAKAKPAPGPEAAASETEAYAKDMRLFWNVTIDSQRSLLGGSLGAAGVQPCGHSLALLLDAVWCASIDQVEVVLKLVGQHRSGLRAHRAGDEISLACLKAVVRLAAGNPATSLAYMQRLLALFAPGLQPRVPRFSCFQRPAPVFESRRSPPAAAAASSPPPAPSSSSSAPSPRRSRSRSQASPTAGRLALGAQPFDYLLGALAAQGSLHAAMVVWSDMQLARFLPSQRTFRQLLQAASRHNQAELFWRVWPLLARASPLHLGTGAADAKRDHIALRHVLMTFARSAQGLQDASHLTRAADIIINDFILATTTTTTTTTTTNTTNTTNTITTTNPDTTNSTTNTISTPTTPTPTTTWARDATNVINCLTDALCARGQAAHALELWSRLRIVRPDLLNESTILSLLHHVHEGGDVQHGQAALAVAAEVGLVLGKRSHACFSLLSTRFPAAAAHGLSLPAPGSP